MLLLCIGCASTDAPSRPVPSPRVEPEASAPRANAASEHHEVHDERDDRTRVAGSTVGVVEGVRIQGRGELAIHTHGGDAAQIAGASFEVVNEREVPVTIELVGARWLTGVSCEPPREERAPLKLAGMALRPGLVEGATTVEIPARSTGTIGVGHEAREAYQGWCERFATAVTFAVGGQRIEVIAEHEVQREEPLRE